MPETRPAPLSEASRQALIAVRDSAYAPYSRHPVGALLVAESGQHYLGCNVESANFKGLCAEAGAISAMIAQGEREIATLYVIGPGEHLCTPCGDCRQRIREFATSATVIVVLDGDGAPLRHYTMEQLLPDSFGPENLPPS
ncbi:cytidine deaminase [Chromohalobacter canadensis]|uniref:cytidine deaminase n=1 Tax=Chromohalobacter canadensis TaxID=141389 RepID=UPI0021C0F9DE|nr:cytidine deaminase [Chromohalobacter canadensis]MCT8467297.1 cytidine deaminase [Chromohalobacter canadensis]MCT8470955.1 cytidine deaminase [Chromohalobacter canadensis]MCT8497794.1 cytidine deaminase [Chromohalobacter canadensis]